MYKERGGSAAVKWCAIPGNCGWVPLDVRPCGGGEGCFADDHKLVAV